MMMIKKNLTNILKNIASILIAPMIAYFLSRNKNYENPIAATAIATSGLFIMMAMNHTVTALDGKTTVDVAGIVTYSELGTQGMFAGIIVGLLATRGTVKRPYTRELIDRFANECQIAMLGSAELVEMAEAKLHGEAVSLEELRRILRPWLRMPEPPDTVVLGCTHFPLLQEELLKVLPEGTRLVDSGAAIARRTAWLLEHEAPDAKSADANIAFCMAITKETEQLLPVLHRYGFETLEKLAL